MVLTEKVGFYEIKVRFMIWISCVVSISKWLKSIKGKQSYITSVLIFLNFCIKDFQNTRTYERS